MSDRGLPSWLLPGLCCCVMLCVIAAYAVLLPRSRWQGDEYLAFALQRQGGWHFLLHWYLTWSPRLVSNVFYATYGAIVLVLHRPLADVCMAVLWAMLACACLVPAWRAPSARIVRLAVGFSLFALFLVGHSVTEVFYWPGGGLSYIPTLAGTVWLFWLLLDGLGTRVSRQMEAALALVVIAGSSEVGIFLAFSIAGCLGCAQFGAKWRHSVWLLPGVAVALTDLALVLHGRVGTIEGDGYDPHLLHHAGASLVQAVTAFVSNLGRPDVPGGAALSTPLSLASRVLILVAAHWSFGRNRAPGWMLRAFGVALLLACFASLASGYYQFGRLCCTRHDTMRACLVTLAAASFGASLPRYRPNAAAPAWALAVLLLFVPAAPAAFADYRSMNRAISARAQTWASGRSPGDAMVFTIDPSGRLMNGAGFSTGSGKLSPDLPWWQQGILMFFGKQTITVQQAK